MSQKIRYIVLIALIVAFGGCLMGFDASVISGVVGFIEPEFALSKIQVGWAEVCPALTAALGIIYVAKSRLNALRVSLVELAGGERSASRTKLTL